MRIYDRRWFCLPLVLAGCQARDGTDASGIAGDRRTPGRTILCAVGSANPMPDCTVERTEGPEGPMLTLHARDGGFRRLRVTADGRGVVAADGAEPAVVTIAGPGTIDVAIGGDRYRLPATIEKSQR